MEIYKSVYNRQEDCIRALLELHTDSQQIDLDPFYSKGNFYKSGEVNQPIFKFDLNPQTEDTTQASSDNLPLESNSIKVIIADPPFIIAGKTYKDNVDGSSKIAKRFGAYENYEQLKEHYYDTLKECYRLLEDGGIVIFKLQNTISGGKQYFTDFFVKKSAIELGFYLKDEIILFNKSKMTSFGGRWKTQQHVMKHHSYFLVLKKCKTKIDYNVH